MESLLNDDSLPIGLGGIGQRQWNDRLRLSGSEQALRERMRKCRR